MEESRGYACRTALLSADRAEAEARVALLEDSEPVVDIWRYWCTVRKHLRVAIAATIAALVAGIVRLYWETPIYTAETTILIEPNAPQHSSEIDKLVAIEAAAANSDQYYKTQCEILKSRDLAVNVIAGLGLEDDPAFNRKPPMPGFLSLLWSGLSMRTRAIVAPAEGKAGREQPPPDEKPRVPPALVHSYLNMLKVTPVADTNLVRISFSTANPRLSARLAAQHVATYARMQVQMDGQQSEEVQQFLRNKLVEIKEQLEKSEAALNDYRRSKGIIPGLTSLDGKEAVVLDRLKDLSKDLAAAQVERIGLEPQVELIRSHRYSSLPAVTADPVIQALEKQLDQLYAENAALSSQFKANYPPLNRLQAKIREIHARLAEEIVRSAEGIRSRYEEALRKESKLQAEMERQRAETLSLNDAAAQYAILQRDVDTNRELFNAVLTRLKDIALSSGSGGSNVTVINSAEVPLAPVSPNKERELILALVVGLGGGIGLAFVLESIDNSLKNPEEAENYLHLPTLGLVPEFASLAGESGYSSGPRIVNQHSACTLPARRELVTLHGSYSSLGEAYRNLRTALLLSCAGAPPRMMLITSAASREGKTVTAVNIAATLAQLGGDTLLIDADLRRARCHRVLAMDNHTGLTEVLTGACDLQEVIRPTEVDNLHFLGAGSVPPNPAELLGSSKMAESLARLRDHCEYIVIDSSPVLPVSDSLLLAKLVDGIVVVANGAATPRQQVRTACARLEYARGKILGLVLNRIQVNNPEYRYYYHQEYYNFTIQTDDHLGDEESA